jgi:integrase
MAGAKLKDIQVSKSKPKQKPYRLPDGHGLYFYVTPAGGKYWRWRFYLNGKEQIMSLGEYPAMSLSDARQEHQEHQRILRGGLNPIAERRERLREAVQEKRRLIPASKPGKATVYPEGSFGAVEEEWFDHWSKEKDSDYAKQMKRRLDADILPKLGNRPIGEIDAPEIMEMVKTVQARGAGQVARRALRTTSQIFRYAIPHGYAKRNPAADIRPSDVLQAVTTRNHPRVNERDLPALLLAIEDYSGAPVTKSAMRLMAMTFMRTSELVEAPWSEFDLDRARWDIPKERMKMPTPHIVPLSRQAAAELHKIRRITGNEQWVFPHDWHPKKCMSKGAIRGALKRMGYGGIMTGHGFRGVATTILREQGYNKDHIEVQLAHTKRGVSAAYDYAEFLEPRTKMMQAWSDYLEEQLRKAKTS